MNPDIYEPRLNIRPSHHFEWDSGRQLWRLRDDLGRIQGVFPSWDEVLYRYYSDMGMEDTDEEAEALQV